MDEQQVTLQTLDKLPPSRRQRLLRAFTSYYAIALGLTLGCASIFGWLADEVLEKEFTSVNTSILLAIHAHRTATLDVLAFSFTDVGSIIGVSIIGSILVGALVRTKRYVDLWTFIAAIGGALLFVFTFKLLFHQIRPQVFAPLTTEIDFSFPSGHSLMSFAVWGFFAWWIVSIRPREKWRWGVAALGLMIALLVALSRLYLGVHWPTDVVAGMLIAFSWIGVCATGQRWFTRHARRERRKQLEGRA